MKSIRLDVRYYHLTRKAYVKEEDFHLKILRHEYPVNRIALVLVDVWSDHFVSTHLERGRNITLERILTVADAFRSVGAAEQQEAGFHLDAGILGQDRGDDVEMGEIAMHQNAGLARRHVVSGERATCPACRSGV